MCKIFRAFCTRKIRDSEANDCKDMNFSNFASTVPEVQMVKMSGWIRHGFPGLAEKG